MRLLTTSLLIALSYRVAAHGIVTKIIVAGTKTYQGYSPDFQYQPTPPAVIGWTAPLTQDRGPVDSDSYTNPDIICHRGATPGKVSAQVAAGDTVSLQWTPWPDSHHGPMLDYLADCGADCTTVDKTKLSFFKIDGVGMTNTAGTPANYADDVMIKNNNTWSVTIPMGIKAGNYVLRHETIALHQAQAVGGAQNYPQCVNLVVTGGGSDTPASVLGTDLYKATDPGILFNIYQQFTSTTAYPIPGPPLYSGAAAPVGAASPSRGSPPSSPAPPASGSPGSSAQAAPGNSPSATAAPVAKSSSSSPSNASGMIGDRCKAYMNAKFVRGGAHARDVRIPQGPH